MAVARPLHLIRGGASSLSTAFRPYAAASRQGARPWSSQRAPGSGPLKPSPPPAAHADGPVDQSVETAVDSHLSRGTTRAFLWISRIARKILKLLAGNPCASPPAKSTNSVTAKAEVLPGGNSRNAGETRATGKPGNRDFSCCFHTGRMVADRQEAGQPAAPVRRGQMGPLRLILGGAPFAYPESPLAYPESPLANTKPPCAEHEAPLRGTRSPPARNTKPPCAEHEAPRARTRSPPVRTRSPPCADAKPPVRGTRSPPARTRSPPFATRAYGKVPVRVPRQPPLPAGAPIPGLPPHHSKSHGSH